MNPDDLAIATEVIKTVGDVASLTVVLATLSSWLPPVTAILSLIWVVIRIYETDTVQNLIYRRGKDDEAD